jgi:resuscitation-promoting factor RpfB
LLLQYSPAQTIQLTYNGQSQTFRSAAASLGDALWQNGITLKGGDSLSVRFSQPLSANMNVVAASAIPLTISVDGETLQTISAAATVGAALAANNISLQYLDYSAPSEDSPLPQDGKISVVRVKLVQLEEQKVTPYSVEYATDATMAAGASVVTRSGQNGVSVSREIVRYENGEEASRETESELVLQEKINELVTKGPSAATTSTTATSTQTTADGAVGTIDTPNGTLSYYYSTSVYATSYSPCRLGTGSCGSTTASGKTLTTGMIAVTRAWYNILKGYQIYVPGYGIGTVEDLGGGVSGKQWIDLGYSDADWVQWSRNVTIYFLTPKPSGFSGSLP